MVLEGKMNFNLLVVVSFDFISHKALSLCVYNYM